MKEFTDDEVLEFELDAGLSGEQMSDLAEQVQAYLALKCGRDNPGVALGIVLTAAYRIAEVVMPDNPLAFLRGQLSALPDGPVSH
jgi:hypothetical protein